MRDRWGFEVKDEQFHEQRSWTPSKRSLPCSIVLGSGALHCSQAGTDVSDNWNPVAWTTTVGERIPITGREWTVQ